MRKDKSSAAHKRSAFAIIDPSYCAEKVLPSPDIKPESAPWLYGYGEFESYRLGLLRGNAFKAKLRIAYPGNYRKYSEHAHFRHTVSGGGTIVIRTNANLRISAERLDIYSEKKASPHVINLPSDIEEGGQIHIKLFSENDVPAMLIEEGPYSTSDGLWQWAEDSVNWMKPEAVSQTESGIIPHLSDNPEIVLSPMKLPDGTFDFGCELFGKVEIRNAEKPEVSVGESLPEALNRNPKYREQCSEMIKAGNATWLSSNIAALRYVRAEGVDAKDIKCKAGFYPVRYRGAFACSDEQLTRIWINSAYTLRLCMHDFLLDGIKRDRLPWVGDLFMSMTSDAYVFADAGIVRRSLTVLGMAGIARTHLNGIIDYSLWWLIAHDYFQRYFNDREYLLREWTKIKESVELLCRSCDSCGMLIKASKDWVFIDWVKTDKLTALQMLWWWSLNSAANLALRVGEKEYAEQCLRHADKLYVALHEKAWDLKDNVWRGTPGDFSSASSRHALFLSVISGIAKPEQMAAVRTALLNKSIEPVGTPYMAGFENMALARLDAVNEMISAVKSYWGGMLDRGATTFWEAYDPRQTDNESYSFYNRPFGKSLCHAWSAGPAAFLPMGIFGLEPVEDGWKRFRIAPDLGNLTWASATVPTPQGEIEITIEEGIMSLNVPDGTVAEWQGLEFTGDVKIKYLEKSQ